MPKVELVVRKGLGLQPGDQTRASSGVVAQKGPRPWNLSAVVGASGTPEKHIKGGQ